MSQQNHPKTMKIQKTPSDGNCSPMIFCKFVYLCVSQQNHSLNPVELGKGVMGCNFVG